MTKKRTGVGAVIFALFLIINPNINIIDILPDFIGYLILLSVIKKAAATVPYFDVAKTYLTRLLWLSVLRFPAALAMVAIRDANTADSDIIVLLTFVFAVAEVLLMVFAISNLFAGLFYLGERIDAPVLFSDYSISKKKRLSVEGLRIVAYTFAISKAALCFLPETLRLTKTVTIGSSVYVQYMSKIYPVVLLLCLVLSTIIGIIFIVSTKGYVVAISKGADVSVSFNSAVEFMYNINKPDTDRRLFTERLFRAIGFLMVGSIFSFDIIFDNFRGINILPHCIYGAFITVGAVLAAREIYGRVKHTAIITGSIYCIISIIAFISSISFLSKYTYQDLIVGDFAKEEYIPVIVFSALELIALISLLVTVALINRKFILSYTGISRGLECYNIEDRDFHRQLIVRGYILYGLAALSGVAKFVQVLLNFKAEIIFAGEEMDSAIITNPLPWWGTVVAAASAFYIIYSFIYYSSLKEEVEFKYKS